MTRETYVSCLEEVIRGFHDSKVQVELLRSISNLLPEADAKRISPLFVTIVRGMDDVINALYEQVDCMESPIDPPDTLYERILSDCQGELPGDCCVRRGDWRAGEEAEQLQLTFGEMPTVEDV